MAGPERIKACPELAEALSEAEGVVEGVAEGSKGQLKDFKLFLMHHKPAISAKNRL